MYTILIVRIVYGVLTVQSQASKQYEKDVRDCAISMTRVGGFTAREFAEKCGFKLTHNLRRRLNKLVESGVLRSVVSYTPENRMAVWYIKPDAENSENQLALPIEGMV